jgi:hypothetical protein
VCQSIARFHKVIRDKGCSVARLPSAAAGAKIKLQNMDPEYMMQKNEDFPLCASGKA